ncbi:MAG: hypothetical protein JWO79_1286 [Actinomycetia bacterium]|nr:hypothetical protein [Actinomycetes bacterium]
MSQSSMRIVVDQPPGRHEVTGDDVGGVLRQRPQFATDLLVQLARIDVVRRLKALLGSAPQLPIRRLRPRGPVLTVTARAARTTPRRAPPVPIRLEPATPTIRTRRPGPPIPAAVSRPRIPPRPITETRTVTRGTRPPITKIRTVTGRTRPPITTGTVALPRPIPTTGPRIPPRPITKTGTVTGGTGPPIARAGPVTRGTVTLRSAIAATGRARPPVSVTWTLLPPVVTPRRAAMRAIRGVRTSASARSIPIYPPAIPTSGPGTTPRTKITRTSITRTRVARTEIARS